MFGTSTVVPQLAQPAPMGPIPWAMRKRIREHVHRVREDPRNVASAETCHAVINGMAVHMESLNRGDLALVAESSHHATERYEALRRITFSINV